MSRIPAAATFGADWLRQREPFDTAARTAAAARLALPAALHALRPPDGMPWRVIDLACGTGANQRWLAPLLGGPQQWLAVDRDAALLRCRAAAPAPGSGAGGSASGSARHEHRGPAGASRDDPLHIGGRDFEAAVVRRRVDLAAGLERLPWHAAHLVTASALLDLVGAGWLRRLVEAATASHVALLMALNADGRHRWRPADPDDARVGALFAAHQRRDKGFGPALGPDAGAELLRLLRAAGWRVASARSDWRLDGSRDEQALVLQRTLIAGIGAAARQQDPAAAALVEGWQRRRDALAGRASLVVGHLDILALPPGVPAA